MAVRLARRTVPLLATLGLAALVGLAARAQEPPHSAELDAAIVRAAKRHGVPEHLVRRIVMRESRYNPHARNHSFWGLMQISYPTARSMGFRGTPEELLNPVTNLTYAVPYLANAFVAAGRREDAAVRLYASGYYATAKNRGMLGLLRTAASAPLNGIRDEVEPQPAPVADNSVWSLFGSSPAPEPAPATAPQQLAYAATPETGVAAAPAQAQIQALVASPPSAAVKSIGRVAEKNGDGGVDMVAGRDGGMAPPKRWQRDGGTTVIARGDQGIDNMVAGAGREIAAPSRRTRKTTLFAQLDAAGAPGSTGAQGAMPIAADAAPIDPTQVAGGQVAAGQVATEASGASGTTNAAPPAESAESAPSGRRHRRHRVRDDK